MNLILTLIIGGIIGWLASILMKTNAQMGIVANVLVGVAGSYFGTLAAAALGLRVYDAPGSWIIAVTGAAVLIFVLRSLGVFKRVPA
jgi:uncharacterized membrane protein YeaQ/YmgE (transglycosylase-associated protein family)